MLGAGSGKQFKDENNIRGVKEVYEEYKNGTLGDSVGQRSIKVRSESRAGFLSMTDSLH